MGRDVLMKLVLPFVVFGYVGWWFAGKLIAIPNLQTFKVLNIIAIAFDIAAVVLLSHFVIGKPRIQALIVGPVAENVMAFFVASHVGMILCSEFGPDGPSRARVEHIAYAVMFYIVAGATFVITNFVTESRLRSLWSVEVRANILGAFFLFGGLVIHLIAAVMDVYT